MRIRRFVVGLLLCFLWPVGSSTAQQVSESELGWTTSKPSEGLFVELNGKYMVPYTAKIPGTDVSFTMVPVPGGIFTMGTPKSEQGRAADEGPQRQVMIDPIWIGKTEVTWAEYRIYMGMYDVFKQASKYGLEPITKDNRVDAVTIPTPIYSFETTYAYGRDPRLPAVSMTHLAAKHYTKWLSGITGLQYRLPTEAEWEYAARAGTNTAYSFGDDARELDKCAGFAVNRPDGPALVGSFLPNAFGLHDMHGNVWEWVIDGHSERYPSSSSPVHWQQAIVWQTEEEHRVVRGGGFQDDPSKLRSAARMASRDSDWKDVDADLPQSPWWYTTDPAFEVGMRLVRSSVELEKDLINKFWNEENEDIAEKVAIRLEEGRGAQGLSTPKLAEAIRRRENELPPLKDGEKLIPPRHRD